jgi:AraC-like DNA-binding protein
MFKPVHSTTGAVMARKSRLEFVDDWVELARRARFDANQLANYCSVSPSQLRRYFLARFAKPTQKLLNELRLWETTKLLSSGLYVKEVAFRLDFPGSSALCHAFRQYFHMSPLEFVVQYRLRAFHVTKPVGVLPDCSSASVSATSPPWEIASRCLCTKHHLVDSPVRLPTPPRCLAPEACSQCPVATRRTVS